MTDTKIKNPNKPENPPEPEPNRPTDVDPKGIVDAPGDPRQPPPPGNPPPGNPSPENPSSGGD